MVRKQFWLALIVAGAVTIAGALPSIDAPTAHAGVLSRLRHSIGSLWSQKQRKREASHGARWRARSIDSRADAVHDRLESAQRILQVASANYFNYFNQMRRTEAKIQTTQRRIKVVSERYATHRARFGRRLAAMQSNGRLGYLNLLLGSRTLSDLSRRTYLYSTLIRYDSELQTSLREDKAELESARNRLSEEWHERDVLQKRANAERVRVAEAAGSQQRLLYSLNNSRSAQLAYAAYQERSAEEIGGLIDRLSARRRAILASYDRDSGSRRHYRRPSRVRRYHRQRVARRVQRMRYIRFGGGGELKPMPIQEVIYHDEMVPIDEGPSPSENSSSNLPPVMP